MSLPIKLIGDYSLDLGLTRTIEINETMTAFYFRTEIYNSKTGIRPNANPPTPLYRIPVNSSSLELVINEHLFNSLFSVLTLNGDLFVKLTDKEIFEKTGLFHLRTSDLSQYIPQLLTKYGDKPMTLILNCNTPPKFTIDRKSVV